MLGDAERFDVVIIGAGTSGAAAAYLLAKRGMRVCCVERNRLDEAGARWVNEVPGWMFDAAGIPRPMPPELREQGGRSHIIAGWGPYPRVIAHTPDSLSVDMRLLVARLQRLARDAGAVFYDREQVYGCTGRRIMTKERAFLGDWVIDAAGVTNPGSTGRPYIPSEHLCAAAQAVYDVPDENDAYDFFGRRNSLLGDVLCYTSVAGGYSVVNVRGYTDELSILTGSIPTTGAPSGKALLEEFVRSQRWLGRRRFGGWRAIPVCSPFSPLFDRRVAFLGDAACQVFPAHGSGIGAGMVAARLLADALANGRGTEGYAASWHRRYGALHCAYDLIRRFSQTLNAKRLAGMMSNYMIDEESVVAGLDHRFPDLSFGKVNLFVSNLRRVPETARPLLRVLLRIPLLRLHHQLYLPNRPQWQSWWWKRLSQLMTVR
jgi:flavin-dependent dehydrogenase